MTPSLFLDLSLRPALSLLPSAMHSEAAQALLLAIALQESQLQYRRQLQHGPARGFWQFERAGVAGVLKHPACATHIRHVLKTLCYGALLTKDKTTQIIACHAALEHNDLLAGVFARLLLWTLPHPLPDQHEPGAGWAQYTEGWRPGKPHPATWDQNFAVAWDVMQQGKVTV